MEISKLQTTRTIMVYLRGVENDEYQSIVGKDKGRATVGSDRDQTGVGSDR